MNSSTRPAKFANPDFVAPPVHAYVQELGFKESPILQRLRLETANNPRARMMGDPSEAALFKLLISAMNVKRIVEVGVFTGYTTLAMAQSLPDSGEIVGLDVSEEFTSVGKPYWKEAGVENKIDLRLGPALESLDKMIAGGEESTYDFAFIDADKVNYEGYYERLLRLVRPNGIIAIDNVLWSGRVVDPKEQGDDTVALRQVNKLVHEDDRVEHVMLPFADGVTLVRKK
mmetsp:Transcript_4349/g.10185  ORF Transcript_4349/g.10185 Transcript_4349/m.10185 type:complete len:229 (-) Transcript_4349:4123-4809(-)